MRRGILGIGVCTLDILTKVKTLPSDESVEEADSAIFMGGGPVHTALAAATYLGSSTTTTRTAMGDLAISNIEEFFKTWKCKNNVN